METDINKALAKALDNLAKLESAREQVEQVTANGKELTEQSTALLGEAGRLVGTLDANTRELLELLTGKVVASEERINRVAEERSALIGSTLNEMKQVFADTETVVCQAVAELRTSAEETVLQVAQEQKGQLNHFQTSLDGKLAQSLTEFRNQLLQFETSAQKLVRESGIDIDKKREAFAVSAQEITEVAVTAVKEVSGLSIKVLSEQQREVNALLAQLKETDEKVCGLLGYIRELDLAAKWLSLESEMKTFRHNVEQSLAAADGRLETLRKGQTYLFYAFGGIALLLLVLKFV